MSFVLRRKNYVDLQGDDFIVPRILTVVIVPEKTEDWLSQSDAELILRRCGYWLSLRQAHPLYDDRDTVTVRVPRAQRFSVQALSKLMQEIGGGSRDSSIEVQ